MNAYLHAGRDSSALSSETASACVVDECGEVDVEKSDREEVKGKGQYRALEASMFLRARSAYALPVMISIVLED